MQMVLKKGAITAGSADGFKEETIDKPLYELDGKLQIYVQHYLYAETTLDLKARLRSWSDSGKNSLLS